MPIIPMSNNAERVPAPLDHNEYKPPKKFMSSLKKPNIQTTDQESSAQKVPKAILKKLESGLKQIDNYLQESSSQLFPGKTRKNAVKNEIATSLLSMGASEESVRSAFEEYDRRHKGAECDFHTISNIVFKSRSGTNDVTNPLWHNRRVNKTTTSISRKRKAPKMSGFFSKGRRLCDPPINKPEHKGYTGGFGAYGIPLYRKRSLVGPSPKRQRLSNGEIQPFPGHMTIEEASTLKAGDAIDFRDSEGRFYRSLVQEKAGNNLKIHYIQWNSKWDEWIDYEKSIHRISFIKLISERPAHRFTDVKVGDFIDVKLEMLGRNWQIAEITDKSKKCGQIEVKYHTDSEGKEYHYWVHLDDENEVAAFGTKSEMIQNNTSNEVNAGNQQKQCDNAQSEQLAPEIVQETSSDNRPRTEGEEKAIEGMRQQIEGLQDRLDLLSAKTDKIGKLNMEELGVLKNEMTRNIERVEEAEREMMEKMYKCIVCMDRRKDVTFDACDHMTLCAECEGKSEIKKCPICQVPYTTVRKIVLY